MKRSSLLILPATAVALLAGCNDSDTTTTVAPPTTQAVTLQFAARAGDTAITCDTPMTGMGSSGDVELHLRDFRFYVGNVRLLDETGGEVPVNLETNAWQLTQDGNSVAMLDFTNKGDSCTGSPKSTNSVVTGTVPVGTYTGVRFELGVPPGLNHTSTASMPSPLNNIAMAWSWQAGRKFAKLESRQVTIDPVTSNPTTVNQTLHLGSTGCSGGDAAHAGDVVCTGGYRPTVTFTGFDITSDVIVADYQVLLDSTSLAAQYSCMPNTTLGGGANQLACDQLLAKVGLDNTGVATGVQSFLRVE
jgi:uncharacterized repeat protein (TIGR04052 family)